ncbi:hypothetical protein GCM10010451_31200 [Streptomyces virens]|uniref:Uncharacterized protein n=1 Tax=Streptomyces virens TaxID=285572 RepID=A0ABP6PIC7_9ACTN
MGLIADPPGRVHGVGSGWCAALGEGAVCVGCVPGVGAVVSVGAALWTATATATAATTATAGLPGRPSRPAVTAGAGAWQAVVVSAGPVRRPAR